MKNYNLLFLIIIAVLLTCCDTTDEIRDVKPRTSHLFLYDKLMDEVAFPSEGEYVETEDGHILRKINDSCFVFGLDMLLTKEQVDNLYDIIVPNYHNQAQTRGTIVTQTKYNWPNKTIPFTFNSNTTISHISMFYQAMSVWSSQTQIRFIPRSTQKDYVEFKAGDGNSSYVGRIGGRQEITIHSTLGTTGNMIHEIGHAVGMIHEHQNYLRDNAIIVHENNIKPEFRNQFQKIIGNQHVASHWMYDRGTPFSSIMMYPSLNSFAINIFNPTMTSSLAFTHPYVDFETKIFRSQRSFLTASDRAAVAWKYGYAYDPATDTTLTHEMIYGTP